MKPVRHGGPVDAVDPLFQFSSIFFSTYSVLSGGFSFRMMQNPTEGA